MRTIFKALVVIAGLCFGACAAAKPTIHLIGASTCSDYEEKYRPQYGWGEMLSQELGGVTVVNHAKPGRSTKSFIAEGRWDKCLAGLKKGDLLLINFGHNDQKKDTARHTAPYGEYYSNLCRFIGEARDKGAVPVIVTSVSRRRFDENGKLQRTLGRYPEAARKAAADTRTPLIDLEKQTSEWLKSLGDEASKPYYMVSVNGTDNTHLTQAGATVVAGMVAKGLRDAGLVRKKKIR